MASLDVAKFRQIFPAFASVDKYPDAMIEFYWDLATNFISDKDSPWRTIRGKILQSCLDFLTAHLMAIADLTSQSGAIGGSATGGQGGFVQSATIGDVTVAKVPPPATNGWQWWLASTSYGQSLWALLSVQAVGGFSVGGLPEREAFRKVGGVFW